MRKPQIHIGCQSWGYEDWITKAGGETVFYPRGTRADEMLELYARVFDTIEVDSTAYGVPPDSSIESWFDKTPKNFTFSLKAPREITHEFSLRPATFSVMDRFIETTMGLREKLGVILIQLPASFEPTTENAKALREFIERLPDDVRFAVEFRHSGWFIDWTYEELVKNRVTLALVEGKWVPREVIFDSIGRTELDSAYLRLMGVRDLEKFDRIYRPRDEELDLWRARIENIKAKEIFIYIDNYFEGHAPGTANKLKSLLGVPAVEPDELEEQGSLF